MAVCNSAAGTWYLCFTHHARSMPKWDCTAKLGHVSFGICMFWASLGARDLPIDRAGTAAPAWGSLGWSLQDLASILGLSIPFSHVSSAAAGGHAEGIPLLGLGIAGLLPPGQTASNSLSLLTGARREPLTQG